MGPSTSTANTAPVESGHPFGQAEQLLSLDVENGLRGVEVLRVAGIGRGVLGWVAAPDEPDDAGAVLPAGPNWHHQTVPEAIDDPTGGRPGFQAGAEDVVVGESFTA